MTGQCGVSKKVIRLINTAVVDQILLYLLNEIHAENPGNPLSIPFVKDTMFVQDCMMRESHEGQYFNKGLSTHKKAA